MNKEHKGNSHFVVLQLIFTRLYVDLFSAERIKMTDFRRKFLAKTFHFFSSGRRGKPRSPAVRVLMGAPHLPRSQSSLHLCAEVAVVAVPKCTTLGVRTPPPSALSDEAGARRRVFHRSNRPTVLSDFHDRTFSHRSAESYGATDTPRPQRISGRSGRISSIIRSSSSSSSVSISTSSRSGVSDKFELTKGCF